MSELLTSAQMRAIEQAAFDSGTATGLDLMERAGQGVVAAVFEAWPDLVEGERSAVVLCGPGNNGGDGFVIARLLRDAGWLVQVFLYGDPERLRGDALANHERWKGMGPVIPFPDWNLDRLPVPDLVVDALFGTGLARALPDDLVAQLRGLDISCPAGTARRVAVDAPSGLCMDSGRVLVSRAREPGEGAASETLPTRQDLTVSFHALKLGHVLQDGPEWCGRVRVADIGLVERELRTIDAGLPEVLKGTAKLATPSVAQLRKGGEDFPHGHKYDYGHVLVLSGGPGRTGAARMAARGALRIGAGLVTLAAPGTATAECAGHLTAVMLRRCNGASDLGAILGDERLNALCLGPGLGVGSVTREFVVTALGSRRRCVLDADALTSFSEDPRQLFAHLHSKVVLTPHTGEFARLFPDIWERYLATPTGGPAFSRVDAAQEAAARAGCVVLLKGADTVIAEPAGRVVVNAAHYERSAPWLATAGAGDVLAGMITGLMAREFWPISAAETATWLHAEAARLFGPGLIAEDLPEQLPKVMRDLGV